MITDGWIGYAGLPDHDHGYPKLIGAMAAHVALKWTHRAFSNLKRWAARHRGTPSPVHTDRPTLSADLACVLKPTAKPN